MVSYVVINKKGGAGKTTTALALVDGLSKAGKKVLAIDVDPQRNMSAVLRADRNLQGAAELLLHQPDPRDVIQNVQENIDLIAGDGSLVDVEPTLYKVMGREMRLQESLQAIHDEYDFCIIDTPPSIGLLTINALAAADKAIVAANAAAFSADGYAELHKDIMAVQKYYNHSLVLEGIVLTRYVERTTLAREMTKEFREMAEKTKTKVFNTKIRENVSIGEAQLTRQLLSDYDKECNGAQDYATLIREMKVL